MKNKRVEVTKGKRKHYFRMEVQQKRGTVSDGARKIFECGQNYIITN